MHITRLDDKAGPYVDLFMAQRSRLLKTAAQITGCMSLAEDVVQDAMIKVCMTSASGTINNPTTYVFKAVRNGAIDCCRKQTRERRYLAPESYGDNVPLAAPSATQAIETCEILTAILRSLDALPARTRYVFEKHRLHGVAQKVLAEELGVSPTLVNFMIRDAHKHCSTVLAAYESEEAQLPSLARVARLGELECAFAELCGQDDGSLKCPKVAKFTKGRQ